MSRGHGVVQREILYLLGQAAHPLSTTEMALWATEEGGSWASRRASVLRAVRRLEGEGLISCASVGRREHGQPTYWTAANSRHT